MTTFALCWWSMSNPEEDDASLVARFRDSVMTDFRSSETSPNGREVFRAFVDRLDFADNHRGTIRADRTRPVTFYTDRTGTHGAYLQQVGIMVDFENDADAVHYRLTFLDEPYEVPQDA